VAGEHLSFVEGTAGPLRVSDGGLGGPAVVFLHRLGSDLEVWRPQLDHLRASRRVIAYDQRGHGASGKPRDGDYTLEALAADLEVVRRALGLERFVLVGHSLSGAVMTTYLGAHPESVAGAVYLDAIGDFHAVARERLQEVVEREASPSFGASEQRAAVAEALGPRAKPATRQAVLATLDSQGLRLAEGVTGGWVHGRYAPPTLGPWVGRIDRVLETAGAGRPDCWITTVQKCARSVRPGKDAAEPVRARLVAARTSLAGSGAAPGQSR
jgi:pimeloyl-ACP methyl ester carboxylesterase